ncbi:hypothetical protein SBA4_860025 [Candidatus Sulfopaludibacter sp. SbA4]|nr:hypothetical protein SBA4_860025 [Candidatus Sulfopaludibacter sp. SbA4]
MKGFNVRQRWCIWLTGVALLASVLFPPWWWRTDPRNPFDTLWHKDSEHNSSDFQIDQGKRRSWLFDPPEAPASVYSFQRGIVVPELSAQIAVMLILGAGLLWVLKNDRA